MNIPNMISIVRILLTPVFAVLYVRGALWQAMGVLLLCAVSDVLDGAIARRFNMVTDLGKALDPAADKLIQIAMMLCAATRTKAAWLLLALHLIRELSLAWDLPKKFVSKLGMQGASITLAGNNLHYFTAVPGVSPEVGTMSTNAAGYNNYPPIRRISLGIRVIF